MTHLCDVCGAVVFTGHYVNYEYPEGSGNMKQDIEGGFVEGTKQCESCGKFFCADHSEIEDGLCPDCIEKEYLHEKVAC